MEDYSDIINLEHPTSRRHPRMSGLNRAAQFAPFAALTGYDASISEEARLTDSFTGPDSETTAELNRRMAVLRDLLCKARQGSGSGISGSTAELPQITVVYFRPDERKSGGSYESISGRLKKIDDYTQELVFVSGKKISLCHIIDIDGKCFE